jgi:hypothetical protein
MVLEYHHVKPGKGGAFVRTKMKNLLTGLVREELFRSGEKFPSPDLEYKQMQGNMGVGVISDRDPQPRPDTGFASRADSLCAGSGSGGSGHYRGGDGIIRDIQLMEDAQVTILSERRKRVPYGLAGGEPGLPGQNLLVREVHVTPLQSKGTFELKAGDVLRILTPGGGGWGELKAI